MLAPLGSGILEGTVRPRIWRAAAAHKVLPLVQHILLLHEEIFHGLISVLHPRG